MFNQDKYLKDLKKEYSDIFIPKDIDGYILKGIEKGSRIKRRSTIRRGSSLVVCILIILFLISIRVSPAFAAYISNIPGIGYIVELINNDKGIKLSVENNFVQRIWFSDQHHDLKVTVNDIIIDSSTMNVFFTIENLGKDRIVQVSRVKYRDEKGGPIIASFSYGTPNNNVLKKSKEFKDVSTLYFKSETIIPEVVTMEIQLEVKDNEGETFKTLPVVWKFELPIDKEFFEQRKEEFTIDQWVEIQGQNIHFKELRMTPTRVEVDIAFDKDNTMRIFDFEDIHLVDEKGEVMNRAPGLIASLISPDERIIYFQSNYFHSPKDLYIKGSSIRALEKDRAEVKIDLDEEKLLNTPDDSIALERIYTGENEKVLEFKFKTKDHFVSFFKSEFRDADGLEFEHIHEEFSYMERDQDGYSNIYRYIIPKGPYKSPIILEIQDYPQRILGEFSIKVK